MGANDVCTASIGAMTPVATFESQFRNALSSFTTARPQSRVFVSSIPNVYRLWALFRTNPLALAVWQQFGICQSMLNINNTETWANIQVIMQHGAAWYAGIGCEKSKGTKTFSLTGNINRTGLIEVPMGIPLRQIIFDIGGGIPHHKEFKGVQTGGPSGGCIPAPMIDLAPDEDPRRGHSTGPAAVAESGGAWRRVPPCQRHGRGCRTREGRRRRPGFCSRELLVAGPDIRWIQVYSAWVERCVAIPALRERGILLTNMQRVAGPVMAEHVIAIMMAFARGLHFYIPERLAARWTQELPPATRMITIEGKTVLVVGLGGIGTEVAKRSHALGMRVIATRASGREGPPYVAYVGLPDELSNIIFFV